MMEEVRHKQKEKRSVNNNPNKQTNQNSNNLSVSLCLYYIQLVGERERISPILILHNSTLYYYIHVAHLALTFT